MGRAEDVHVDLKRKKTGQPGATTEVCNGSLLPAFFRSDVISLCEARQSVGDVNEEQGERTAANE